MFQKGKAVPAPLVPSVILLLWQIQWLVMNEERTGLWLQRASDTTEILLKVALNTLTQPLYCVIKIQKSEY